MTIFVSYNREDRAFVDKLAKHLVNLRHNVWVDRWEMNIGDSIINKIQNALKDSDAILVVLSRRSVASEWCKRELNAGLVRELEERKILVLPCVIDDCEIPLFLRDKLYADFRHDPEEALNQVHNSLLKITNTQMGRSGDSEHYQDWSYDWSTGRATGLWYFRWTFVDHGSAMEHCILTQCQIACNEAATEIFNLLKEGPDRQTYIRRALESLTKVTTAQKLKIVLPDAFEQVELLDIPGFGEEHWLCEITSRRMGNDNGKDVLVHVDQILERALEHLKTAAAAA